MPCATPSALLEQLRQQGLIERALAAFYFDPMRGTGSCLMGAVESARFDPATLNLLPVQPLAGELSYLWTVCLDRLEIAGATPAESASLVLDTGSSCFKGGHAIIKRMIDAITDRGKRPDQVSDPAALVDYPDLKLVLGGRLYTLKPADYFLPITPSTWKMGVQYLEGLPDELLVVWSVFLDSMYSIFHYETLTEGRCAVSLAMPRHPKLSVSGVWKNDFGSLLEIGAVAPDGTFRGVYRSHTGATGVYPVVGVADPQPIGDNLAVSFSVSWRSLQGDEDPSWHWVSGFTGLLQESGGQEILNTTYLLQQNADKKTPAWMATAIFPSTFRRA